MQAIGQSPSRLAKFLLPFAECLRLLFPQETRCVPRLTCLCHWHALPDFQLELIQKQRVFMANATTDTTLHSIFFYRRLRGLRSKRCHTRRA